MSVRIILLFSFLSFLLLLRIFHFSLHKPSLINGQEVAFTTTVITEPSNFSSANMFIANYGDFFGNLPINIIYSKNISLHYGDVVRISGKIKEKVLSKNRKIFEADFPKIEAISQGENIFLSLALFIRQKAEKIYAQTLSNRETALLLGIVLGEKKTLSPEFYTQLQNAGVVHIVAASGMNVSMTGGFFFWVFTYFFKRKVAVILSCMAILFYATVSGMQPSIVRATIMGIFLLVGQLIGKQYSGMWGLWLAVWIMLFVSPNLLADVGFQLSVLATLGIFALKPIFPKYALLEDFHTTLSAQIATLPILLTSFGTFSYISLLVNVLVLWTVPYLMIIGAISLLLGCIWESLGTFVLWFAVPLLWYFQQVLSLFGSDVFNLHVQEIPVLLVIGYYCIVTSVVLFFWRKSS